jgi:phosphotransferase system HPr (HPr) family protein
MKHHIDDSANEVSVEKEFIVQSQDGLNVFLTKEIARTAGRSASQLILKYREWSVEVKEILDVLSLGVCPGERIRLCAYGSAAEQDLRALEELLCRHCALATVCSKRAGMPSQVA